MKIHPAVNHSNGMVTVLLTPSFVGDPTDPDDRDRIVAHGAPQINMGGAFSDGAITPFTFGTAAPEVWVRLTDEMQGRPVRFMTQLPPAEPNRPAPTAGPLDVITADPVRAAQVYVPAIMARIQTAMGQLRAKIPSKLTSIPDATI